MLPNERAIKNRCLPLVLAALLAAAANPARGDEPAVRFEVHDVSLWILDPGNKTANSREAIPSGFPVTVNSTRTATSSLEARRVAPAQLLTFHGQPVAGLDVDLRAKSGSFLAHWPSGESLTNRLRWAGKPSYDLVESIEDESELMFVDADDWINRARQGDALYVKRGARSERFLAYDAELKLDPPIRLTGGPDRFEVINASDSTLYDVLIARSTPEGCRVAWLDELPPSKPAPGSEPPPQAKPAADPALKLFEDPADKPAEAPAAKIDPSAPGAGLFGGLPGAKANQADHAHQEAPAEKPVDPAELRKRAEKGIELLRRAGIVRGTVKYPDAAANGQLFGGLPKLVKLVGVEVALSKPLAAGTSQSQSQTTQALAGRLEKAGLTPHEGRLFAEHYAPLLFEDKALVVACRLAPPTIDEQLPLSIFPAPSKTVRAALVLVRNADPQLSQQVDELIDQLGAAEFAARETAQQRLLEMGSLAFPALKKALKGKDPEIVVRAERILLLQNQTPDAKAGAAMGARGGAAMNAWLVAPAIAR